MSSYRVTTPGDATWWRRSRLLEPRSVLGAIGIVAIVAAYVLIVPYAAETAEYSDGPGDGGRFAVDDYTTIVLADGWYVDNKSEFFTIISDGTYQLVLPPSVEESTTPEEILAQFHDAFEEDPANQVTDITSFTTDDGAPAAQYRAVIASDPSGNGSAFAAVSQNGRSLSPSVIGPANLDDPYYETFLAMVRSIVISSEPMEGSS